MAQFPISDSSDIIDGLNYALSGPGGLGQNFAGFSTYTPGYLTGNYRAPFSQTSPANLYVPPIALGTSEMLDGNTWKFTFAAAEATPPFAPGQIISVSGVTDPYYDGSYTPIGVTECTTTYVIARTSTTYALVPSSTGGTVELSNVNVLTSTDCDIRVTVTGAQDRVFVSGQLDQLISYTDSGTSDLDVYVTITRYQAQPNNDPVNPEYIFGNQQIIVQKVYSQTGLSGTGTLPLIETVFSSIQDTPVPGLYRYILEVNFVTEDTIQVTQDELLLRSISAQVVKP
jgi:hypothetical protein